MALPAAMELGRAERSCGARSGCKRYSGRLWAPPRSEDPGSHQCPWLHAEGGSEEIDGSLVALLQKDEVVRKVTQIFCLERLAAGDTITARTLLANMVAVRALSTTLLGSEHVPLSCERVACIGDVSAETLQQMALTPLSILLLAPHVREPHTKPELSIPACAPCICTCFTIMLQAETKLNLETQWHLNHTNLCDLRAQCS